jgi:di/tricarboxylate transporter
MIKRLTFAAILLVFVLAACTPLSTPTSAIMALTATSTGKLAGITPENYGTKKAPATTVVAATRDNIANCTVVSSIFPTPNPTQAAQVSLFKPVSDSDYILGNKEASITFLEYSDFQ